MGGGDCQLEHSALCLPPLHYLVPANQEGLQMFCSSPGLFALWCHRAGQVNSLDLSNRLMSKRGPHPQGAHLLPDEVHVHVPWAGTRVYSPHAREGGGASANRTICGADTPPPSAQAGPGCGAPARRGRRCGCTTGSGGTRAESRGQPGRTCGAKRAAADRRHTARGWPPWAAGRCPKELCRGLAKKPCRPSRDSTAPPPHPPIDQRYGWAGCSGRRLAPGDRIPVAGES